MDNNHEFYPMNFATKLIQSLLCFFWPATRTDLIILFFTLPQPPLIPTMIVNWKVQQCIAPLSTYLEPNLSKEQRPDKLSLLASENLKTFNKGPQRIKRDVKNVFPTFGVVDIESEIIERDIPTILCDVDHLRSQACQMQHEFNEAG